MATGKDTMCDICLVNKAVTKGYWISNEGTDAESSQKLPCCHVCVNLNWESVAKLLSKSKGARLRTIKGWWEKDKMETLKRCYPAVQWEKVRSA